MQNQNCYIEFDIVEEQNFIDLKETFELLKEAKNTGRPQPDQFWLDTFPEYSLKQFDFLDNDLKPSFPTGDKGVFTWHFYSLTSLLQTDYEIEYVDCYKMSDNKGRIEYAPYSYPYGGITGLITFIASFNCKPTIIDDGTSVYEIAFQDTGDFSITDLEDPKRQNSSVERFNGVDLLENFGTGLNDFLRQPTRVLPIVGLDVGATCCILLSALVRAEETLLNIRINF